MFQRGLGIERLPAVLLTVVTVLLVSCGQVVTPSPTPMSPAVATATSPGGRSVRQPTGTPLPLPPADTATPTITPTPVVHVVQRGDTLQAIAFDYGVALDALQSANGIDDPQLLQVGQELIIPLRTESEETTSGLLLPTPTPQPVQVQGTAFYRTPVGSLWGIGEVANTTDVALTNVQVKVMLFDSSGELVVEEDTFVAAELIPPGESSPFGLLFTTVPNWASYQMTVVRADQAGGLAEAYVPILVSEVSGTPVEAQFKVGGTVKHDGSGQATRSIDIVVTTYDADGVVTGFREQTLNLDEGLTPGATADFTVLLTPHVAFPDSFDVIALGRASGT